MTRSVIDNLPEAKRQQIIDALLAGESLRKVAGRLGISHVQVGAYKRKVVVPAIRTAQKLNALQTVTDTVEGQITDTVSLTRAALAADPIRARIAKHQETVDRNVATAEANEDPRAVAALISTDLKAVELDCRLTGRLDASPSSQTNLVVPVQVNITMHQDEVLGTGIGSKSK